MEDNAINPPSHKSDNPSAYSEEDASDVLASHSDDVQVGDAADVAPAWQDNDNAISCRNNHGCDDNDEPSFIQLMLMITNHYCTDMHAHKRNYKENREESSFQMDVQWKEGFMQWDLAQQQ